MNHPAILRAVPRKTWEEGTGKQHLIPIGKTLCCYDSDSIHNVLFMSAVSQIREVCNQSEGAAVPVYTGGRSEG